MKKSILATLILGSLYSPLATSTEPQNHPFSKDIVLRCANECDIDNIIKNYIKNRKYFYSGEQRITVEQYGQEVFVTTVEDYFRVIAQETRSLSGQNNTSNSPLNLNKSIQSLNPGMISPLDGSLTCENDPDFTCEEWNDNDAAWEIANFVANTRIVFTVTQTYLDGCQDAANLGATLILGAIALPAANALVARYGLELAAQHLLNAGIGASYRAVADQIGEAVCDFALPGDKIIVEDGQVIVEPSEAEFTDDSVGSDWGDPIEGFDDNSGLTCVRMITGVHGSSYSTVEWMCYFG